METILIIVLGLLALPTVWFLQMCFSGRTPAGFARNYVFSKLVGFHGVHQNEPHLSPREMYIRVVQMHPGYENRQMAEVLVSQAEAAARSSGMWDLKLWNVVATLAMMDYAEAAGRDLTPYEITQIIAAIQEKIPNHH